MIGKHQRIWRWSYALLIIGIVSAGGLLFWQGPRRQANQPTPTTKMPPNGINELEALLIRPILESESHDVALGNLLCAQGLPGAEGLETSNCIAVLDGWANRVRLETERHLGKFYKSPAQFQSSIEVFRMVMLGTVLQEDFKVGYNPQRMTAVGDFEPNEVFFADSRDVFLHGLLSGKRQGTCSSLPILYLAVGRRLGYPLKLATAKAHLFLRWEDSKARFNIECTGRGVGIYDDDHYRQWPVPMTPEEETEGGYLKSLSNAETLAVFLNLRGQCLLTAGRGEEALYAHSEAVRIAPQLKSCQLVLERARMEVSKNQSHAQVPVPNQPRVTPPPTLAIEPNPLNRIRTP